MFVFNKIFYFIIFIFICFNSYAEELIDKDHYFFQNLLNVQKKHNIDIILSEEDIKNYKTIFALQKEGKWKEANKIIDLLDNKILMGHVKYQKLMHPTKYRSPYSELKSWLESYNDHPMADKIWKLADRRKPKDAKTLQKPLKLDRLSGYGMDNNSTIPYKSFKVSKKYYELYHKIRNLVRRGRPTQALKYLNSKEGLSDNIYDDLRGIISAGYFSVGKDKESFKLAINAASRTGEYNPILYWRAGLAAYRLDKKDIAINNFNKLSELKIDNWLKAAGAYWAAKVHKEIDSSAKINHYLITASQQEDTFYGQLAIESLGINDYIDWEIQNRGSFFEKYIFDNMHFKRAVALSLIGQYGEADQEVRFLYNYYKANNLEKLLELTNYLNVPAVQLRLGDKLSQRGKKNYTALYPKPNWFAQKELLIDEAFLWALIRKESSFYLKAKSNRGARGLMQLMPSTARMVAKDRSIRGANKWKLYDLKYNILIGQNLLLRLLEVEKISNSMIPILISWNAGPSRYEQWNKKISQYNDPLLYIESIPSYETRWFVKKVLKNLWIYRDNFGQIKYSRKALVNNSWPKYKNLNLME